MSLAENVFYKVTVKTLAVDPDTGKQKKRRDEYIVQGISPTDIEVKVTTALEGYEFDIHQMTQTKILEVVKSTDENDYYFKVSIKTEYEDARGKLKARKEEYIVQGNSPTDV